MTDIEKLKKLFLAHKSNSDSEFNRIAESIIADHQVSNQHTVAMELRKALGGNDFEKNAKKSFLSNALKPINSDISTLKNLIVFKDANLDSSRLILSERAKVELERLILEQHKYDQLKNYGLAPKNKLLFWGPPGNGKTLTAQYVAYELGLPFGILQLSSVISSFLGDTASNIQKVFDFIESNPMVLLIDEVDSIAKSRDDANDVGELKRVVNSLLQSIDGLKNTRSIVIAATNHHGLLDQAVWRRFDTVVEFPLPDKSQRAEFLRKFLNGVALSTSIDKVTAQTEGLAIYDIEKIIREAIKTMILSGQNSLNEKTIMSHIDHFRLAFQTKTPIKKAISKKIVKKSKNKK